jgi:DNA-directed RNA polymerase specialized sigma24 family protein
MGANAPAEDSFAEVVKVFCGPVYNYAFRMTLNRDRAAAVVEETLLRAYVRQEDTPAQPNRVTAWLLRIAHHVLAKQLRRTPEVDFDVLDDTLRSEATRTDVVRSLTDPQRDFLLWELKQGCMTAVINCLSPGERAAFTLAHVLAVPDGDATAILGVTASAYKVRLSRARNKVTNYLAPRCEHIDPLNPCRCPARVGIALKRGFIRSGGEVNLRQPVVPFGRYGPGPHGDDAPLRDVAAVYESLPTPALPDGLLARLLEQISSGAWARVRAKKAR